MKSIPTILLAFAISIVSLSAFSLETAPPGYFKPQKVVYHNDGGSPDNAAYFKRMLNSIKNHVEALGKVEFEIRVVDHGGGVDMFQLANTEKDIPHRLASQKTSPRRFFFL